MPLITHPRLLRHQWLAMRARLSIPGLLTRFDEVKAVSVITAINGSLAILTLGLLAWAADLPLLFPALGPSSFFLFGTSLSPSAAPRSVIAGHLTAIASGWAVFHAVGLATGGDVSLASGGWPTYLSASLALGLTALLLIRFSCPHPPACASSLVIALGGIGD